MFESPLDSETIKEDRHANSPREAAGDMSSSLSRLAQILALAGQAQSNMQATHSFPRMTLGRLLINASSMHRLLGLNATERQ